MNKSLEKTHLEFYRQHKIAPVRYDLSNLDAHLERRFSLYAKLGLPPISFKKSKVLEVAAGTGHNSLYLAQLMPEHLVLLEPNAVAVEHIHQVYTEFIRPHTKPQVISSKLENYTPNTTFDIVLCENWLGTSQHELSLLKKLSELVAVNGMLVLTSMSPIGFVPNILRRLLSIYLAPRDKEFHERTQILVSAFGSHLDTLSAMTRNKVDWVQDNMLNPAYFKLCLSIPHLIEQLGSRFDVIGSTPVFCEDWRWFKALHGSNRKFNEHFLSEYWKNAHNFLDHREQAFIGDSDLNCILEKKAISLIDAVAFHEETYLQNNLDTSSSLAHVQSLLDAFISVMPTHFQSAHRGLNEVLNLIGSPSEITTQTVANMSDFRGFFGRETSYVSLIRI